MPPHMSPPNDPGRRAPRALPRGENAGGSLAQWRWELVEARVQLSELMLNEKQMQNGLLRVLDNLTDSLSSWQPEEDKNIPLEVFGSREQTAPEPPTPSSYVAHGKGDFNGNGSGTNGYNGSSGLDFEIGESEEMHNKPGIVKMGSAERQASKNMQKNRCSFGNAALTEVDELLMLQNMFKVYEADLEEQERIRVEKQKPVNYFVNEVRGMDKQMFELLVDSIMGGIIVVNAIFIGFSMDLSDGGALWNVIEVLFSIIFCFEIGLKISLHGVFVQFCGPARMSNCFDAGLIFIDVFQLVLVALSNGGDGSGAPNASLFRVIRLGKLTRVLRLLRAHVFRDLLAMMQGMIGGLQTLGWSMVLYLATIYVVSLLSRESFGRDETKDHVYDQFNSVPRAMFTIFRCSFGDCSDPYGVPIFEYVHKYYGGFYTLGYSIFIFVVSIGLFNVISAIFVESTMAVASAMSNQKKKSRLQDSKRWDTNIACLIKRLIELSDDHHIEKLSENVDEVYGLELPCAKIDELSKDPVGIRALTALDIDAADREGLSEILDPDNGGTINVVELVEGIRRLRGEPRRSDIVIVNLMIRSIQKDISELMSALVSD
eukprot:TRINITY_DN45729_c0_g1_i1.p1 TRINITY_DN45729_c0_g1~~TRINITY_DN45729_c0_g1_i1.p1  ORF type:complete len:600 (-),score=116.12 TRINITY_DN45729_c0_g1_i1:76-1875(-)